MANFVENTFFNGTFSKLQPTSNGNADFICSEWNFRRISMWVKSYVLIGFNLYVTCFSWFDFS